MTASFEFKARMHDLSAHDRHGADAGIVAWEFTSAAFSSLSKATRLPTSFRRHSCSTMSLSVAVLLLPEGFALAELLAAAAGVALGFESVKADRAVAGWRFNFFPVILIHSGSPS
jgi:hypothetical protein